MATTKFRVIKKTIQSDSSGRIYLGSEVGSRFYRVSMNDLGKIVLKPVVTIPKWEAWLFKNTGALSAVRQGLQESAAGLSADLGSFAQYADLCLEDE